MPSVDVVVLLGVAAEQFGYPRVFVGTAALVLVAPLVLSRWPIVSRTESAAVPAE